MLLNKDNIFSDLSEKYECPHPDRSYSPLFSSIGLLAEDGENGIGALFLHYNRESRALFHKTINLPIAYNANASDFTQLVCGKKELQLSFYDKNAFTVTCYGDKTVSLFADADEHTISFWLEDVTEKCAWIYGYSKNGDARDPDESVPFCIGIRVCKGKLFANNNMLFIRAQENNIRFHVVTECLEIDRNRMSDILSAAPETVSEAAEMTRRWAMESASSLRLHLADESLAPVIRSSVLGLLFNVTKAEGKLKRHLSAFPSRGTYPTHFLWDTCFQNLAYEQLSLPLAKDLLLQNMDLQREDGKYEQFLCSTWARPHDSQPALIGWAALRLAQKTDNKDFCRKALLSLEKNNNWWLEQRITDCGLIYTLGGLETGQDNSPRFDHGPTIAADMNAYLLHQMIATAELAWICGDDDRGKKWKSCADHFGKKLTQYLFDENDCIFYDRDLASRETIRVISPSGLLPLWAGDILPDAIAGKMIRCHLLNPEEMFGAVPFPSVAYNDPKYVHDDWWRGPTWMPIAFLMLECLEKYGFKKEKEIASKRLYNIIAKDTSLHELFDSASGAGLGAAQQGWTCAVFLALIDQLWNE